MKEVDKHYNLAHIQSKKDLNGKKPSVYIIESNRSDGKTTAVLSYFIKCFKERQEQFGLFYRYQYELADSCKLFTLALKLNGMENCVIESSPMAHGLFYELQIYYLDNDGNVNEGYTIGYSFGLGKPELLKKYSTIFTKVERVFFDEFILEKGSGYLPQEPDKVLSALISIGRGSTDTRMRDIELYMCANKISLMNPYYIQFGIHKRKRHDTKFLRGNGWVAHFNYNPQAADDIKETGFASAFSNSHHFQYATEDVYLFNDEVFIETPSGRSRYFLTIKHEGAYYGVRHFLNQDILYISENGDKNFPQVMAFKNSDHDEGLILLTHASSVWKFIRKMYSAGKIRFDGVKSKNALFDILAIDIAK